MKTASLSQAGRGRDGSVAVVTGASSGIGRELALQLAAGGARVCMVARRANKLDELVERIGNDRAVAVCGDVGDRELCRHAIETAVERFGKLDLLINNAGASMNALFEESDPRVFEDMMRVNYFGSVYMSQYALPHLRASGGSLIFISSVVGKRGFATRSGYAAAKFAIQGLFESLRVEYRGSTVHVGLVCPGYTETEIRSTALGADGRPRAEEGMTAGSVMPAADAAAAILEACAKRRRETVLTTGGKFMVALNRFCPALAERIASRVVG